MIILNQPWSHYDHQLDLERRRLAVRRGIICGLYCAACLCLGVLLGILMRGH